MFFQDFEKKLGMFLAQNIQYLADIKLNISVEDPNFTENLIQGSFSIQVNFIQLRTVYFQGSFSIQVDFIQLRTVYSKVHSPYKQILYSLEPTPGFIFHTGGSYTAQNLLQPYKQILYSLEPTPRFIFHTGRSYTAQNLLQGSFSMQVDLMEIEPTLGFMLHTGRSYTDRTYSRVHFPYWQIFTDRTGSWVHSPYRQILYRQNLLQVSFSIQVDLIQIEPTPGFMLHTVGSYTDRTYSRVYSPYRQIL